MTAHPEHANEPVNPPKPADEAAPASPPASPPPAPSHHTLSRTRVSGVWTAVGCFAIVLLLLLIFILQNSRTVDVSYFGAHGHLPLGVALLLAAVCGVLLVLIPGGARILQLRATARKHRRADARRLSDGRPADPPVPAPRA